MLSKDVRRKLSEIGRGAKAPGEAAPAPIHPVTERAASGEDLRARDAAPRTRARRPRERPLGPAQPLAALCSGEEVETELGAVWTMRAPATRFLGGESVASAFLSAARRPELREMHRDFHWLCDVAPGDVLFLDTETAGLSSVPLFLCGFMWLEGNEFVIEQLLARDYSEEPALLTRIRDALERHELLITFNGKTFDIPFLNDRLAYHLIEYRFEGRHLDLLQHARRRYRGKLPDCKLQTLERHLCGRPPRPDDIPGEEIPQAYHDFVASSNASILRPIIEHNALDLIALAEITVKLTEPHQ